MSLLNTNGKSHVSPKNVSTHLRLIFQKRERGIILLLNTNRTSDVESPMCHYIWQWVTLKEKVQGHLYIKYFISCNEVQLRNMFLLTPNGNSYIGTPTTVSIRFEFEWPWTSSLRRSYFKHLYLWKEWTSVGVWD